MIYDPYLDNENIFPEDAVTTISESDPFSSPAYMDNSNAPDIVVVDSSLPTDTTPDTGTPEPEPPTPNTNNFIQWIKDHPIPSAALGIGLFMLLDEKKERVGNAPNKNLIIALAVGAGVYFLAKKNASDNTIPDVTGDSNPIIVEPQDPQATLPPPPPITDPYAYSNLDRDYYNQMYQLLSSSNAWQQKPYFGNFADEVLKEYRYIVDGHPTSPDYSVGVPGAFMVAVLNWYKSLGSSFLMIGFAQTLTALRDRYLKYLNQRNQL